MRPHRVPISLWIALLTVAFGGCGVTGPSTQDLVVRGVVEADGEPLARASVRLETAGPGPSASAQSEEDGSFELTLRDPWCGQYMYFIVTKLGYQLNVQVFSPHRCPGPVEGVRLSMEPNPPLLIETGELPAGVPTLAYSEQLVAIGGDRDYRWSLSDGTVPDGLSLDGAGWIRGTPTASGVWSFTVQVQDGRGLGQTATADLSIAVRDAVVLRPRDLCATNPDTAVVTFSNQDLMRAVRRQSGIAADELLTCGVVTGMTELEAHALPTDVSSLAGLQNLTSLTRLDLSGNLIPAIGELEGLTSLKTLLFGANQVVDITSLSSLTMLDTLDISHNDIASLTALSGLGSLTFLDARENDIVDVAPLAGLTALEYLSLQSNGLSDIGPLAGLASVADLDLAQTTVTDISALEGLTTLDRLMLWGNPPLPDIDPLVANTGLGAGDVVSFGQTVVPCSGVERLRAKGVTVVTSTCG